MPNVRLWLDIAHPDWILVWVKKNTISRSSLGGFNVWEPIFFYGKPKKKIGQDIYDIPITVQQDAAADDGSLLHPTPKQVKLWAAMIEDFTDSDDVLYEPFAGSGTTPVSAEQTGRVCYGMEIEPKYVAVAVALQRISDMGLTPRLASE
jgi:DNA modification methylase